LKKEKKEIQKRWSKSREGCVGEGALAQPFKLKKKQVGGPWKGGKKKKTLTWEEGKGSGSSEKS